MKTTKEIAELFCAELDRIGAGKVRKDVIAGLERCSNAMVKLARSEMDYAWKNWDGNKPCVPWVASSVNVERTLKAPQLEKAAEEARTIKETASEYDVRVVPKAVSVRIQDLQKEIDAAEAELKDPKSTATIKRILQDKIQSWTNKIEFLQHTKGKVQE